MPPSTLPSFQDPIPEHCHDCGGHVHTDGALSRQRLASRRKPTDARWTSREIPQCPKPGMNR
eukprot:4388543-Lingulodinium_polyedra.AAC.2